ncbi:hypothetical protein [Flagellimonas sp.]|uniref:hypothetical protein n=1 Tax=Flagellimonas sp. TaxID=2058762 RepID=UPI003BB12575
MLLFQLSEHRVHRNNAFTRRYPHHPINKRYDLPLGFDSYYIAGIDNDMLYLGNTTAPLHMLEVNLKTRDTVHITLGLSDRDLPFQAVSVRVRSPYYYVMDGTVPCIFRGILGNWNAGVWMKDKAYFTKALPLGPDSFLINTINSDTQLSSLGLLTKQNGFKVSLNPRILEKQIDGMFDVDGTMVASPDGSAVGFVYYYRNQFMVMDSQLGLLARQETVDTVSTAQIELASANKKGLVQMKAPPLKINHTAALYKDLMMVNSPRLGKYEEPRMLDQASIIDVYNWRESTYAFSFYLYHIGRKKLKEFRVRDGQLIAVVGDMLSVYGLDKGQFKILGKPRTDSEKHNDLSADNRTKTENL